MLLASSVLVKLIGAVYKIPLTSYIGAVGRGYFAYAYNLVMPVHIVTMGVLPVALSKLVSTYSSKNEMSRVASLRRSSLVLFSIIGFVCSLLLLLLTKVYCTYIVGAQKAIYTCVVLIPTVLFSCIACSYRGYYEGLLNMQPTAISQTLEALFKMIFGLLLARFTTSHFILEFENSSTVFDELVDNLDEALSLIYPISACAAMLGVTLGSLFSLLFLRIYSAFDTRLKAVPTNTRSAGKELLIFSLPIMISTGVQSVFQFLDNASIQRSLDKINLSLLRNQLSDALAICNVSDSDLPTYAFGLLSSSLDFKNLIPGITMALGVCAVPVISSAFEQKNMQRLKLLSDSIVKYTALLSCLGALLLCVCSGDILNMFYAASSPDIAVGGKRIVVAFALTAPIYSIAGTAVFFVQSVGFAKKSILPYAVCGAIRVVLNIILFQNDKILIFAPVISGAVGYIILAAWNLLIFSKNTKVSLSFVKSIIFPVVLYILCYICYFSYFRDLLVFENEIISFVIKSVICVIFYMILCFLCGLLNFSDIFRYFNHKKIPETLENTEDIV